MQASQVMRSVSWNVRKTCSLCLLGFVFVVCLAGFASQRLIDQQLPQSHTESRSITTESPQRRRALTELWLVSVSPFYSRNNLAVSGSEYDYASEETDTPPRTLLDSDEQFPTVPDEYPEELIEEATETISKPHAHVQKIQHAQNLMDLQSTSPTGSKINSLPGFLFHPSRAKWDDTRRYKIHDFVVTGDDWEDLHGPNSTSLVCMATQSSVDKLYSLADTVPNWEGPTSVGVFVPEIDFEIATRYIYYLRECFPAIKKNVSFHYAYPVGHLPKTSNSKKRAVRTFSCLDPFGVLQELLLLRPINANLSADKLLFPFNHMRNLARKTCQTEFVFMTDIDIIPKTGLGPELNEFLSSKSAQERASKAVFVVPTYEINETVALPRTKDELLQLVKDKMAQTYRTVVFYHNQHYTNSSRWETTPAKNPNAISLAYSIDIKFYYEPFYVARDSVPPHDERFIGYGYTRNTQVYETRMAGYEFWVLNNAFSLHKGLIMSKKQHSWRLKQVRKNLRKKFPGFRKEKELIYGKEMIMPIKK